LHGDGECIPEMPAFGAPRARKISEVGFIRLSRQKRQEKTLNQKRKY
jgi:hypothetical protein